MPRFFGGRTIMKRTISEDIAGAAGAGNAAADVAPEAARRPLRELLDDRLLERSRDQAGGLRLTGEGSMLGELIRASRSGGSTRPTFLFRSKRLSAMRTCENGGH
jgi:hypothetical protein